LSLENKDIVLITGGLGTVGYMIVEILLLSGYTVLTTTHDKSKKSKAPNFMYMYCDFDHENWIDYFEEWVKSNPNFTIKYLINNVRNKSNLLVDDLVSKQQWVREFNFSTIVPYTLTNFFKKTLTNVININSIYGVVVPNKNIYDNDKSLPPIHYGVCKSSSLKLTKEMSIRLLNYKISINSLVLGGFSSGTPDKLKNSYEKICPTGKMLNIKNLKKPILFLLESDYDSFNGKELTIDGGWTMI